MALFPASSGGSPIKSAQIPSGASTSANTGVYITDINVANAIVVMVQLNNAYRSIIFTGTDGSIAIQVLDANIAPVKGASISGTLYYIER